MSAQQLTREKADKLTSDWFKKVDALDVDGTMSLCDEETIITFGNGPSLKGDAPNRQMFTGFYSNFDKMRHEVRRVSIDVEHNTIFIRSDVGYFVKNKADPVVVPVMSVMDFGSSTWGEQDSPKFADFRVYLDISPVIAHF